MCHFFSYRGGGDTHRMKVEGGTCTETATQAGSLGTTKRAARGPIRHTQAQLRLRGEARAIAAVRSTSRGRWLCRAHSAQAYHVLQDVEHLLHGLCVCCQVLEHE